MNKSVVILIVVALLFGCSSVALPGERGEQGPPGAQGPAGPPGASAEGVVHHGDRLRAATWTSTDGLAVPAFGAWDIELQTPCGFGIAEDGVRRCLPSGLTVQYINADCAGPAVAGASCAAGFEPRYAAEQVAGEACSGLLLRIYQLGSAVESPTAVWFRSASNGVCVSGALASGQYFEVGTVVDPDEFPLITLTLGD